MGVDRAVLPDRQWTTTAALAGLFGIVSYGMLAFMDTSPPVSALLTSLFSLGFGLSAIGIYYGVVRTAAPRLGLLAAVANTVAGAELMAMLLVQIAVKTAVPRPGPAMTGIWLGLDVAWDVFGCVGTVLLAVALWQARFRVLGAIGALAGAALLALNLGTFPTPPGEAGLVDLGPLVALWYMVLCVRLLLVVAGEVVEARRAVAAAVSAQAVAEVEGVPSRVKS